MFVLFGAFSYGNTSYDCGKKVLDNGAIIISKYIPDSPLVTINIRFSSGLSNEGKYASSGISHFLEHLLFKGTNNKNSDQIRREIKQMGGVINGTTGLDSAQYYITVPVENFYKALNLITSMVTEPVFSKKDFKKERSVVLKEMKMNEDEPSTKRVKLLFSEAYLDNVYKNPVIGYLEKFKQLTSSDLIEYHSAVYTPEKMVIGIVGGIKKEEALNKVSGIVQEYERGEPWDAMIQKEPRQVSSREVRFKEDINLGYLAIGFHSTDLYSEDLFALDAAGMILGGGKDSRLYKEIVEKKQLLYDISCVNYTPRYPGLFIITGIGDTDKIGKAKIEIFNVINEISTSNILDVEITKIKNQIVLEYLRAHEKTSDMAGLMTEAELLTGDYNFFEKYSEGIKSVDKEDIKRVLKKYLLKENSTTIFLFPKDFTEEKKDIKVTRITEKVKSIRLKNGLKVIIKEKKALPIVAITLAARGGLISEHSKNNGIANLMSTLLLKGTKTRTQEDINAEIETSGGDVGSFSGMNTMGIYMDVLSDKVDIGLNILSDIASNSIFDEKEIIKEKKKIIAMIEEQEKNIYAKGILALKKILYRGHPYSMRTIGDIKSVNNIKRSDIKNFYDSYFKPNGLVLTVVGDIDVDDFSVKIKKYFESWEGKVKKIYIEKAKPLEQKYEEDIKMDKEQALFLLGFQGVKIYDKRKYALSLISALLSGSDGYLFNNIREKKGFSYTSGALNVPEVDTGYFLIYVATVEKNIKEVKKAVINLIKKINKGKITKSDIASSKRRLVTEYISSLETGSALSLSMALNEICGLGWDNYKHFDDNISSLTKKDIVDCAKDILKLNDSAVVVVHSDK